jgi:hypothetical protein
VGNFSNKRGTGNNNHAPLAVTMPVAGANITSTIDLRACSRALTAASSSPTPLPARSMAAHPKIFYYLFGLAVCSAIVGLVAFLAAFAGVARGTLTGRNSGGCGNCGYLFIGPADDSCCCCCRGNHCTPGALACDCGSCSAEAGPFLLIVLAGLVLVGLVVIVVAGVVCIQRLLQRHMHMLHKHGLTQEFVVRDLAAEDGGLSAIARVETGGMGARGGGEYGQVTELQDPPIDGWGTNAPQHSATAPYHEEYEDDDAFMPHSEPSAPPLSEQQRRELVQLGLL